MSRRKRTVEAIENLIKEINQIELEQSACIHTHNSAAALLIEEFFCISIFIF